MTEPGKQVDAALQPRRRLAALAVIASLIVVAGIVWLLALLHPLPPRTITMATGPEGSAYVEFGKRYRDLLSREGIDLRLVTTAEAVENLARLRDPDSEVQIAFLSGGLTSHAASPRLFSLGTVAYEPLWLFTRGESAGQDLRGLQARRLSIGPEGSATRTLSLELLKLNAENPRFIDLSGLTPEQEGEELVQGRIDAAMMLTSWDSPVVRRLIVADAIHLVSFPRADAYVALFPYLTKLVVPMGVGDLATERPPRDVTLLATRTSLVARADLHPALQYLLLEVATQVHSGAEIFQKPGEFPAAESIDLPLSSHALHYYKSGRPFLQRYLPFWLAVMGEQLLVPGHSDRRHPVPSGERPVGAVWLGNAAADLSHLRRAAVARVRDGDSRRRPDNRRSVGAASGAGAAHPSCPGPADLHPPPLHPEGTPGPCARPAGTIAPVPRPRVDGMTLTGPTITA
jgi:TRAP-type uncharacterized transport system substrate-binding protein